MKNFIKKPYNLINFRFKTLIFQKYTLTCTKGGQNDTCYLEMTRGVRGCSVQSRCCDILCGPAESKIRQLERQLREERSSHQMTKRFVK